MIDSENKKIEELTRVINAVFTDIARENPEKVTQWGSIKCIEEFRRDDAITEETLSAFERRKTLFGEHLSRLKKHGNQDVIAYLAPDIRSVIFYLKTIINDLNDSIFTHPFNAVNGIQTSFPMFLAFIQPVHDEKSAENFTARLKGMAAKIDNWLQFVKIQASRNYLPPQPIIDKIIDSIDRFVAYRAVDHFLFKVFHERMHHAGLEPLFRQRQKARAEYYLQKLIFPALEKVNHFFKDNYSNAPVDCGLCHVKNGEDHYQNCLNKHTTLDLSPDEIFHIGEEEVERIQNEISGELSSLGINAKNYLDGRDKYLKKLREGSYPIRLYDPNTEQADGILGDYKAIIEDAQNRTEAMFGFQTEMPVQMRAVPDSLKENVAGAFYRRPSFDGHRPGYFFVNLNHIPLAPAMHTLCYHEAVPGHHFQISTQMLQPTIPLLRKTINFTAFTEGWALYTEKIARDFRWFPSRHHHIFSLFSDLFRAARLMVDTGLHFHGWSRSTAVSFMSHFIGRDAGTEVDRYIVNPGQACAYKIGEKYLLKLRGEFKEKRSSETYMKEFHASILKKGALSLPELKNYLRNIARRETKNTDSPISLEDRRNH